MKYPTWLNNGMMFITAFALIACIPLPGGSKPGSSGAEQAGAELSALDQETVDELKTLLEGGGGQEDGFKKCADNFGLDITNLKRLATKHSFFPGEFDKNIESHLVGFFEFAFNSNPHLREMGKVNYHHLPEFLSNFIALDPPLSSEMSDLFLDGLMSRGATANSIKNTVKMTAQCFGIQLSFGECKEGVCGGLYLDEVEKFETPINEKFDPLGPQILGEFGKYIGAMASSKFLITEQGVFMVKPSFTDVNEGEFSFSLDKVD